MYPNKETRDIRRDTLRQESDALLKQKRDIEKHLDRIEDEIKALNIIDGLEKNV